MTNEQHNSVTIFDVSFNMTKRKLPTLIGLPALRGKKSNIAFEKINLWIDSRRILRTLRFTILRCICGSSAQNKIYSLSVSHS